MSWTFRTQGEHPVEITVDRDAAVVHIYIGRRCVQPEHLRLEPEEADVLAEVIRTTASRIRVNRELGEP